MTPSAVYTHEPLNVHAANARTVEAFVDAGCERYAELGMYLGHTAERIAEHLDGRGAVHLFDYEDRVAPVMQRLRQRGYGNVVAHPNSRRTFDSYNWSLMELLREDPAPRFDYVFIDGAHTWATDALAFFLIDRLLVPGGLVDFDDYSWTLAASPSMSPEAFPATSEHYTDAQIREPQVALIVDLLVRPDPRYDEVIPNKVFRKQA